MSQQVSQSNMQAQLTRGTGSSGGHDRRGDDNRRNDRRPYYNNNRVEKRQRCTWCRGFGHVKNDCRYFSIYRMIGQFGLQLGQARQQQSRGRGRGRGRGSSFGQQRGGHHYQHHQYNNQVQQQQFVAPPANNQQTMRRAAERVNTPAAVQPDPAALQQAMANMREALRQRGLSEEDIDRVARGQQPRQQGDGDTQNGR